MDDIYIKFRSEWVYLCRAIDKFGKDPPTKILLKPAALITVWAKFALGMGLNRQQEGITVMLNTAFTYSPKSSKVNVSSDMFGINILTHKDSVSAGGRFPTTIESIGASVVRYPGGTVTEDFFDLSNPNQTSGSGFLSGNLAKNLLPLSTFMAYAAEDAKQVLIVLPTYRYFDTETGALTTEAEQEVRTFINDVLSGSYGNATIRGFEIGNEWYQEKFEWTAAQFGKLQAKIAQWVQEEATALGIDPDIYVQAGRGDDDGNGIDDNVELAAAFTRQQIAAVDGLISHLYLATSTTDPLILGGNVRDRLTSANRIWEQRFGHQLEHVVTEWNIGESGPNSTTINGLMRSAPLMRLFATMVDSGIDAAAAWTAQASSPAAMSGPEGGDGRLTPTGLLFRMLSHYLPGTTMNSIDNQSTLRSSSGAAVGYCYSFVDGAQTILVMTSGVGESIRVSAQVSAVLTPSSHVFGMILGALDGTTGTEFNARGQIEIVNRPDLEGSVQNDGKLDFTLDPFELVMVVITNGAPVEILADPQSRVDDLLIGSEAGDLIFSYDGDDTIQGMAGDDELHPGSGADSIYGGSGDDRVVMEDDFHFFDGGDGFDELDFSNLLSGPVSIWEGVVEFDSSEAGYFSSVEKVTGSSYNDRILLTEVLKFVDGHHGDDFILLDEGDGKTVCGGEGDDVIISNTSVNVLHGGSGNDRVSTRGDSSIIDGDRGNDIITISGSGNWVKDSQGDDLYFLNGTLGTTLDFTGGAGNNTVYGFDPSVQRLLMTSEQRAESNVSIVQGNGHLTSLLIQNSDFSLLLNGVVTMPYSIFQDDIADFVQMLGSHQDVGLL